MFSPPSSPLLDKGSTSRGKLQDCALQQFLTELEDVRQGPLRELESTLVEVKVLHGKALHGTTAAAEKETLARVESCAERASAAAQRACTSLQALANEVDCAPSATEANLRRQSFAGVSALFQNALNAYYQAQQGFRQEMQAKVSRQLRAAFPEADDAAVAAVAAGGQSSAAAAIQDTLRLQPGSSNLSISLALQAGQDRCDELERLARAARDLRQRFVDVEVQIWSQGEVLTNIEHHVGATRHRTQAAREQLQLAVASQTACRVRWCIIVIILAAILAIFIVTVLPRH